MHIKYFSAVTSLSLSLKFLSEVEVDLKLILETIWTIEHIDGKDIF